MGRAQVLQKSEEYNNNTKSANWTFRRVLGRLGGFVPGQIGWQLSGLEVFGFFGELSVDKSINRL